MYSPHQSESVEPVPYWINGHGRVRNPRCCRNVSEIGSESCCWPELQYGHRINCAVALVDSRHTSYELVRGWCEMCELSCNCIRRKCRRWIYVLVSVCLRLNLYGKRTICRYLFQHVKCQRKLSFWFSISLHHTHTQLHSLHSRSDKFRRMQQRNDFNPNTWCTAERKHNFKFYIFNGRTHRHTTQLQWETFCREEKPTTTAGRSGMLMLRGTIRRLERNSPPICWIKIICALRTPAQHGPSACTSATVCNTTAPHTGTKGKSVAANARNGAQHIDQNENAS